MKGPTPIMSSRLRATAPRRVRVRGRMAGLGSVMWMSLSVTGWEYGEGVRDLNPMTTLGASSLRRLAVWGLLGVAVPAVAQATVDKANLSGERVKVETAAPLAVDEGAAGLEQTLKKLGTRASLMLIVAHPDDEDGGMLAYEARGMGVHAAMLTLTRGEGGQNLMSADFNDALGLVRTEELLAAGRYMGADQMFGTEVDFGFSKTKEESFTQWGHDRVLYDAVRAVRLYRPLVIAAVFVGGLTDGHGQHQVSGEIAQEVFEAAGDPKVFPEMGLAPWSPLKVYARAPFARVTDKGMYDYATNKYEPVRFYNYVTKTWTTQEPTPNVVVPEGEFSKILGMSYVQFARKGLALQKTQIGGGVRLAPAGKFDVGYTRYGSRLPGEALPEHETGFFKGIDTSVKGIAGLAPGAGAWLSDGLGRIQGLVEQAQGEFSMEAPEKTAPALAEGLKAVEALIARVEASGLQGAVQSDVLHELRLKRVEFNKALVQALGVRLEATGATASVVPGQEAEVKVNVGIRNADETYPSATSVAVTGGGGMALSNGLPAKSADMENAPKGEYKHEFTVRVPQGMAPTQVDFARKDEEQPYYTNRDAGMRNAPLPLPAVVARTTVRYRDVGIELASAVMAAGGTGVAETPMEVVPAISVAVAPEGGIVRLGEKSIAVTARVKTEIAGATGTVRLAMPEGWRAQPAEMPVSLAKVGDVAEVTFRVSPVGVTSGKAYPLTAVATVGGREYREGYRAVGYAGLPGVNLYRTATDRVVGVDVKVAPGLKVAYLPGTGDGVEEAMAEMGVKATTISVEDVAAGQLAGYDAVVLGVRVYAAHPELNNAKLLAYAAAGGTVIVQYNTGEMPAGPYPLSLGDSEKVVDEGAKVTLEKPDAQALQWPNRISETDFAGWVEERGHGFMGTWDPRYEALTEVHDPGQDPQRGGLLVAKTGEGHYVYLAYALYRQLPEGVPGSYRLLANLLSLGRKPK
jgi:LmbE family N-acetylglucosaminyl deacetylase